MGKYREFQEVILKDGRIAAIVEILGEGVYIADVGDSPADWDDIVISEDDIVRAVEEWRK